MGWTNSENSDDFSTNLAKFRTKFVLNFSEIIHFERIPTANNQIDWNNCFWIRKYLIAFKITFSLIHLKFWWKNKILNSNWYSEKNCQKICKIRSKFLKYPCEMWIFVPWNPTGIRDRVIFRPDFVRKIPLFYFQYFAMSFTLNGMSGWK